MPKADPVQELVLAKAAAAEWLEKYRVAEKRVEVVWNLALDGARMRLGHHLPRCTDPCMQCWFYDEIGNMMRGDRNNYLPVKDRMRVRAHDLKENCKLDPAKRKAYAKGINDLLAAIEPMLADKE